eukprot:COSAG04_NODE_4553_length_2021_cov_1.214880_2_plen_477_part_01
MDAALLGLTSVSARMLIDRATMGPGYGYRFPAFGPPGPDSDPPADQIANHNSALNWMLLQPGDDPSGSVVVFPAWPCWDVAFKLAAPRNTTVELSYQRGEIVKLEVTPPERRSALVFANCANATTNGRAKSDDAEATMPSPGCTSNIYGAGANVTALGCEASSPASVAYALYAENFPGACWGEKINAAITHAMSYGRGSAEIVLPPGNLNISVPIRFWRQIKSGTVDTTCAGTKHTRSIVAAWNCTRGAQASDLPEGLTLRGIGGSTGNVFEGGSRLTWVGPPDNVMIEMPAPWHCRIKQIALHGMWVRGVAGIRYRAGWDFGTNGGKQNLFEDLVFEGLDTGMIIGDPLSPDLVNTVVQRVDCFGSRQCFLLFGANVAEIHLRDISLTHFQRAGFLVLGTSGRKVRTRAQREVSPALPMREGYIPTVLTDVDDATEICWEDLPVYAQKSTPALLHKDLGPQGGAEAGGGGPTFTIS